MLAFMMSFLFFDTFLKKVAAETYLSAANFVITDNVLIFSTSPAPRLD